MDKEISILSHYYEEKTKKGRKCRIIYFRISSSGEEKPMLRSEANKLYPELVRTYEETNGIKSKQNNPKKRKTPARDTGANKNEGENPSDKPTDTRADEKHVKFDLDVPTPTLNNLPILNFLPTDTYPSHETPTKMLNNAPPLHEEFNEDVSYKKEEALISNNTMMQKFNELTTHVTELSNSQNTSRNNSYENVIQQLQIENTRLMQELQNRNTEIDLIRIDDAHWQGVCEVTLEQASEMSKDAKEIYYIMNEAIKYIPAIKNLIAAVESADKICKERTVNTKHSIKVATNTGLYTEDENNNNPQY